MKELLPKCDRCGREIDRSREQTTDQPIVFGTTFVNRRTIPARALASIEFRTHKDADLCVECQEALFAEALHWLQTHTGFLVPVVVAARPMRRPGPIPASRGIPAGR